MGRRAGRSTSAARDLVTWATRLRHSGWVSPFGGRAKLPWNLEWAAQWSLFGVTIEPCGKDLATAGGSRDRSDAIAREVFEREPPLNVPYEFLNIGGKKMSTSKGRGAAAHEIVEVLPPEQLRFLFLRPRPNQAIEFDPDGTDAIPRLFDEFDRLARRDRRPRGPGRAAAGLRGDRSATRCSTRTPTSPPRRPRSGPPFAPPRAARSRSRASTSRRAMAAEKGSAARPSARRTILDERVAAARAWLEPTRPTSARSRSVRDALPAEAAALDDEQRALPRPRSPSASTPSDRAGRRRVAGR